METNLVPIDVMPPNFRYAVSWLRTLGTVYNGNIRLPSLLAYEIAIISRVPGGYKIPKMEAFDAEAPIFAWILGDMG